MAAVVDAVVVVIVGGGWWLSWVVGGGCRGRGCRCRGCLGWWWLTSSAVGCVGYKHCCGMFTTLHKRKAHYSRLRSTLVPSVACQTTEGEYHLLTILLLTDTL